MGQENTRESILQENIEQENIHALRIAALREEMHRDGIDFWMIPTADFHASEYVAPYFQTREFFSGFTGSNGTLLVGLEEAGLWTDGRYFIQAEKELDGSGIVLYRMGEKGVPDIPQFLLDKIPGDGTLAFDGRIISVKEEKDLEKKLAAKNARFVIDRDPAEGIWTGRPGMPAGPVFVLHEEKLAGETAVSKLKRLRDQMEKAGAAYYVSSRLDDIMWLLNIRGMDVECNPVALSYLFVTKDSFSLFLREAEVTDDLLPHLEAAGGEVRSYERFEEFLRAYDYGDGKVMMDPRSFSCRLGRAVRAEKIYGSSPLEAFKAVKNETEIRNLRECYVDDSAALTRFIYFLRKRAEKALRDGDEYLTDPIDDENVDGSDSLGAYLNEYSAAMRLDGLRRQIRDFVELSFPTISAYGPNAAMMHYEATVRDHADLKPEGMYLVDSGGQYLRGTTDVTRTVALGPVTDDMIRHYTLTLAAQMELQHAVFLHGCTGRNLDILARSYFWKEGMDYKCGTGHGIGYLLNVHEGPQRISWQKPAEGAPEAVMEAGMIVSDEPGAYRENLYGIRIETILLCVEKEETPDGRFLCFEPLTFVPLDRRLIDKSILQPQMISWVNEYQEEVYRRIAPFLSEKERAWLREETLPL